MDISKLPAFRLSNRHRQFVVVVGLCAVFQVVGVYAGSSYFSSSTISEYVTAENNMRQKLIKRLMPADPESTEVMLAARGLDCFDRSQALT